MDPSNYPLTVRSIAQRTGRAPSPDLLEELGAWVLVGPPLASRADDWSYRTISAERLRDGDGSEEVLFEAAFLVLPVRKRSKSGAFASTVLIGRATTNDVCIMHQSISKLHARVRLTHGAALLSDAGSSNGTFLNEQLAIDETPLKHGVHVRFGSCAFQLFETGRFLPLLTRLSALGA